MHLYVNLDAGLDGDGRDLLDDIGWGVQVDQTLVDWAQEIYVSPFKDPYWAPY